MQDMFANVQLLAAVFNNCMKSVDLDIIDFEIVKIHSIFNFVIVTVMYMKVYISGMEMILILIINLTKYLIHFFEKIITIYNFMVKNWSQFFKF